jgi:hypothetical protein
MNFREYLEEQEKIDESLWGLAKGGWNTFAGAMTMGDEVLSRIVGDGTEGRFRNGGKQFVRGVRQIFVGDPPPEEPKPQPEIKGSKWFVTREGKKYGPFSSEEVRIMAADGELLPDDLMWKEGMPSWRRASESKFMASKKPAEIERPRQPDADAKMDAATERAKSNDEKWEELSKKLKTSRRNDERADILARLAVLDFDRYMATFGNARTRSNRRREGSWGA